MFDSVRKKLKSGGFHDYYLLLEAGCLTVKE